MTQVGFSIAVVTLEFIQQELKTGKIRQLLSAEFSLPARSVDIYALLRYKGYYLPQRRIPL